MKDFNTLTISNMCKSFGNLHVLQDFNLSINRGEFVTFLGPSGCGKSTALNCISGLLNITSGKIQVDDEVLDNGKNTFVSPEKRGFGIIFQNYALFPHMSVYDNIAFSLSVAHKPKEEISRKVAEAVRMVHLEGQEHKLPSQLSGGQQQRVAIARSVIMAPRLLLLDEPLSNLDTKLRTEMRYELKQLHNRLERASVYVTHDQSEALALSDKIVVMKIGKIQQIGTPEQVYLHPVNRFVADFMGYKNIWKAKIDSIDESKDSRKLYLSSCQNSFMVCEKIGINKILEDKVTNAFKNKENVLLASRPDDYAFGASDSNTIKALIDGIEYLGFTNQVTGKFASDELVQARVDTSTHVCEGEMAPFHISPDKLIVLPMDEED